MVCEFLVIYTHDIGNINLNDPVEPTKPHF